jgi:hypothetical protein
MAKKVQSTEMKNAYGQRFSQQDLTDPKENQNPQYLKTPESQEGGVALLATLARNLKVSFAGGGRKKTQARDDRKV